jgi:hypothetical protein
MAPYCSPIITNCTFSSNQAATFGGGIRDRIWSSATITNCILWGNTAPTESQISDEVNSAATVNYSDVQGGWSGAGGVGNINADPCFADANGPDDVVGTSDDNLWLSQGSPCIDKGDNSSVPADTVDLDNDANTTEQTPWDRTGHPRFADGDGNDTIIVDMGAYEFSWAYTGDFVQDLSINLPDFAVLASSWLQSNPLVDIAPPPDGDGIVDFKDLAVLFDYWLEGF